MSYQILAADPVDLDNYDHVIVCMSGGKDSVACALFLLALGVPKSKLELWHHDVDGREGSSLMDWPCTRDYCRAFAEAFGLPLYYSWKVGGFEREMLRDQRATAPIAYETPDGLIYSGGAGKPNTRLRFPQVSADLSVRWCSAYLKIDVAAAAIRGQDRFLGKRVLVVTGERAEESPARAKYKTFEPHRADLRNGGRRARHVDQWRAVHGWSEADIWGILRQYAVNPHPAYWCGFGRVSCALCIFGSANQWATVRAMLAEQFASVAAYEAQFGTTIQRKLTVVQNADRGRIYAGMRDVDVRAALSGTFTQPMILEDWTLPAGAFGESTGPT